MIKNIIISTALLLFLLSCSGDAENKENREILIDIKGNVITVSDYKKALEIAKTGYQHNFTQNKKSIAFVKERLLKQMTEELLVKTFAKDNEIAVSKKELKENVDRIKGEYPDDVFNQMLLENAVSFDVWKERLKTRLLMEKVIKTVITPKIKVTTDDMKEFYKKYYKNNLPPEKTELAKIRKENTNALLVQLLRKKKTEELYKKWIDEIRTKYNVKTDHNLWKKITN